ncbi:MAG: hypothetical protein ACPGRF_07425, partial [Miltoncostaeaceae bacterium]
MLVSLAVIIGIFAAIPPHDVADGNVTTGIIVGLLLLAGLVGWEIYRTVNDPYPEVRAGTDILVLVAGVIVVFSVVFFAGVLTIGWALVVSRFVERRRVDQAVDKVGNRLLIAGLISIVAGAAFRMLFITEDELLAGVPPAKTSIRLFWFLLFTAIMVWVLAR